MRRLRKIKKLEEIALEGIDLEAQQIGDELEELKLSDRKGNFIVIKRAGYESFKVLIQAEPKMKKVWRLNYKVLDKQHTEDFDDEYEASRRSEKISGEIQESTPEMKQIEVPSNEL